MNKIYPKRTDEEEEDDFLNRILPWRPWRKWNEDYPRVWHGEGCLTARKLQKFANRIARKENSYGSL